ncbi:hypothetical protein QYF61_013543 [Mycteria americana]|uniref:Interferon-induced transmembrane protein 5 n=1 Tax=Mycteria americana TaxID=33587 RepID=A0AAN7NTV9_MYCAM|nr:hypothetical protein QYF61_013543 [Mycteria americana]
MPPAPSTCPLAGAAPAGPDRGGESWSQRGSESSRGEAEGKNPEAKTVGPGGSRGVQSRQTAWDGRTATLLAGGEPAGSVALPGGPNCRLRGSRSHVAGLEEARGGSCGQPRLRCPVSRLLQARDRKVAGDVEAARRFSSKARCYNALATAGSVVLPLLLAALVVTGVIHLSKLAQESVGFFTYQFSGSDDEDK